jgi:Ca2+-binding RTX toxin-like protein
LASNGGSGDDWLIGGNGYDMLAGGSGADWLVGGAGRDTVTYWGSPAGVWVSLYGDFAHFGEAEGDKLDGIEDLWGTWYSDYLAGDDNKNELHGFDGNDVLVGYGSSDSLAGGSGDDWLFGGDGIDYLYGGSGNDRLYGGMGGDEMDGGSGADTFVLTDPAQSNGSSWNMDLIHSFNRAEGDLIDLSAFDTNVYAAGDQAFTFIGDASHPFTAPGQASWYISGDPAGGNNTYILLNTDLDAGAEGVIEVLGVHAVDASWFVL